MLSSIIFPQALANPAIEDYPESMSKLPKELSPGEEAFALQCKVEKLSPLREYEFFPGRKWRIDFAFVGNGKKVAVEIEGGSGIYGRHQRPGGFEKDAEKYNCAAIMGWFVLRYTTQMVMRGDAINEVLEILGT
jgi:very-short-patch-repair endonuclease